jgi:hypothetical protein
MRFFREVILRFKAKTPKFFERIRNVSLALATTLPVVFLAPEQYPDWVLAWAKHGMVLCLVVSIIAQLTCKEPPKIEEEK